MRLYFVRHGESEANLLREFSNRGLKHGLTPKGRQQSEALAQALRGASVVAIYSSPLLRAIETSRILSGALGVPYEVTGALREYDVGILEGKSDPASWAVFFDVQRDWLEHGFWERRIEGGESLIDLRDRFVPFVEMLAQRYRDQNGAVVLVGHGGLYRCALPLVMRNVDLKFSAERAIDNTGYVLAEWQPDGWRCVEWCGEAVG